MTGCKRSRYWGRGGAGMMFVCPEDHSVLLLLRAHWVEQGGTWGVPGGGIGEGFYPTPVKPIADKRIFLDKALQEVEEECSALPPGFDPESDIVGKTVYEDCGFRYVTFVARVTPEQKRAWKLRSLDGETDEFRWVDAEAVRLGARVDGMPLHFGVEYSVAQGALAGV